MLATLAFCFKMVLGSARQKGTIASGVVALCVVLIANVAIFLFTEVLQKTYKPIFFLFFASWNTMTMVLVLSLVLIVSFFIFWYLIIAPRYYPINADISREVARQIPSSVLPFNRSKFLFKYRMTDPLTTTYRKCFTSDSEINIAIMNLLTPSDQSMQEISNWVLAFKSSRLRSQYSAFVMNKFSKLFLKSLAIASLGLAVYLSVNYSYDPSADTSDLLSYISIFILVPVLYLCTFYFNWSTKVLAYTITFHSVLLLSSIWICSSVWTDYSILGTIIILFISLNYSIPLIIFVPMTVVSLLGFGLNFVWNKNRIKMRLWPQEDSSVYPILSIAFVYTLIIIATVLLRYKNEKLIKEDFLSGASLGSTLSIVKDLLSLLLPKFVLDRMQNFFEISGEKQVFDEEDCVSIMFCDIADFDDVVRKNEGNIVNLLDRIFRKFDDFCQLHGIQKIETVGKTYMAAAGLKAVESTLSQEITKINPTVRLLNFSKDMMSHIDEYPGLGLKIGLHVGKPVMGVIGYHKPQFSLIGDVVNTTSRHCTTGKKGHIMLSADAWELVKNFNPDSMGYRIDIIPTEMKGKGLVSVYHLYPSKNKFLVHIQSIIARKDTIQNESQKKQIEIIADMMIKVSIKKRKSKEGGSKFIQLIELLKSRGVLGNLYSKFGNNPSGSKSQTSPTAQIKGPGNSINPDPSNGAPLMSNPNDTFYDDPFSDRVLEDHEEHEENVNSYNLKAERLIPGRILNFQASQYDIVRKFNRNLKRSNYNLLRRFFILLTAQQLLQLVLHIIYKNELEPMNRNNRTTRIYVS